MVNAIKAIALYETKTNISRKSMIQTEREEDKVVENANNKRKWEDLSGISTDPTSGISNRLDTRCCTCSTGTLLIGAFRNGRIVKTAAGTIRQRLYKTQFLTLGSSSLVCEEEG
uniref:Uncharacterized protein n=1 Tax=Tanacetum cinerariifolium TaxID=118510 RepID=A0A699HHF1_TANCI|nr:hypothetical protein [Tanacetum cinerariifolium]GEY17863.1 hypothetical protein [Tanacetum cinerariifolium]